ncbi:MAG: hypothetical protein ACREYE_32945, partial [Gammaproteobacteria bacterium]
EDIIKKIERARVKMEQIKPGSTLPRGKKEGGLTVKLFKGHYTTDISKQDPSPNTSGKIAPGSRMSSKQERITER